jgi:hypothetical protein
MPKNNTTETVSFSLPSDLIDILDYCCGQLDVNRSAAAKLAIKHWIAVEISKRPEFWHRLSYGITNRSKQKLIF